MAKTSTYEDMRRWYENGGRKTVARRATLARAAGKSISESLRVDHRLLDIPMDY